MTNGAPVNSAEEVAREISIPLSDATLGGTLGIPRNAAGLVLFAHGSGSSRRSPRNAFVARALQHAGLATLLFDLLTVTEESTDIDTRQYRFDIPFLADRLAATTQWAIGESGIPALPLGYFGASTGSAAALIAAARLNGQIRAVVSRGGRPDLAGDALASVTAPTLLIVGSADEEVLSLNVAALNDLRCDKSLEIVSGASHLFEEPGALQDVAALAGNWFFHHLEPAVSVPPG